MDSACLPIPGIQQPLFRVLFFGVIAFFFFGPVAGNGLLSQATVTLGETPAMPFARRSPQLGLLIQEGWGGSRDP